LIGSLVGSRYGESSHVSRGMNTRVMLSESAAARSRSAPRWHIDAQALQVLETVFGMEQFPNVDTRKQLGQDLKVSSRQIQVWFQNRRQRERKLRGEGSNLSSKDDLSVCDDSSVERLDSPGGLGSPRAMRGGLPLAPLPQELQASPTRISAASERTGSGGIKLETLQAVGRQPSEGEVTAATETKSESGDSSQTVAPMATDSWMSMVPSVHQGPIGYCWQSDTLPPPASDGVPGDRLPPKHPYPVNELPQSFPFGGKRESSGHGKKQSVGQAHNVAPPAVPSVAARLAAACQSTILGRTLQHYGGIVQAITEGMAPYRVLSVSSGWQRLCGYTRDEAIGQTLSFLQGPLTDRLVLNSLMTAVRACRPVSVRLTNYDKHGRSFEHQLSIEPLRDPSGQTRCFQATSLVVRRPGEQEIECASVAGPMPLVCTDPMPPLWRLLGRAVRPDGQGCTSGSASLPSGGALLTHPTAGQGQVSLAGGGAPSSAAVSSMGGALPGSGVGAEDLPVDDEILNWLSNGKAEETDLNAFFDVARVAPDQR